MYNLLAVNLCCQVHRTADAPAEPYAGVRMHTAVFSI